MLTWARFGYVSALTVLCAALTAWQAVPVVACQSRSPSRSGRLTRPLCAGSARVLPARSTAGLVLAILGSTTQNASRALARVGAQA